jgi:uncharacterized protein YbjT (DUF2867 family)
MGAPAVAIAGASGFVGGALVRELAPSRPVIALARRAGGRAGSAGVEWRACDLFNLRDAERALAGAEVAVYLVHSMMPSAGLTQGSFDDLDLICADNFARAATANGVHHIVYLGGLLPPTHEALSRHLKSRFEVEQTLASRGVPLTTLRAGLVIGAGGSSFDMMARLVGRLPFMIGPRWTRSRSQPIALGDTVKLLAFAIDHPELAGKAYDIGGPDVVSYADMLRMTGEAQGKHTRVVTVPVPTVKLSLLWVSVITGASQSLVRPLVESLRHDMVATDGLVLQKRAGLEPAPLRAALREAVAEDARATHRGRTPRPRRAGTARANRVYSVQRLPLPPGHGAEWVAEEYARWLPRFLYPLVFVSVDETRTCRLTLWPLRDPLLVLRFAPERSAPDRQLFDVVGGLLVGDAPGLRPRLEFRSVLGGAFALAAVHDYVPRLPWFVYKLTQALAHVRIMRAFARHLGGQRAGRTPRVWKPRSVAR